MGFNSGFKGLKYTVLSDTGHMPSGSLQSDKQMFRIVDISFPVMSFLGRHLSRYTVILILYMYNLKRLTYRRFHLEDWIQQNIWTFSCVLY